MCENIQVVLTEIIEDILNVFVDNTSLFTDVTEQFCADISEPNFLFEDNLTHIEDISKPIADNTKRRNLEHL